ncbi:23694_t:CDS:2 [Dentiscutata erythropus]|uniref:23694_t:CDS:1 n=1 Tax=Dentiscutata erythropus TaxID=1348616 RepID=A0A9N8VZ00_9GLOM|nr:23694_t:CDS:2 [Dentiscutata erythropus]
MHLWKIGADPHFLSSKFLNIHASASLGNTKILPGDISSLQADRAQLILHDISIGDCHISSPTAVIWPSCDAIDFSWILIPTSLQRLHNAAISLLIVFLNFRFINLRSL